MHNGISEGIMAPIVLSGGQSDRKYYAEVPPRVQVALSFLSDLTLKTSVHRAGEMESHDGFNQGKGQELSVEEQKTQMTALDLLCRYFNGSLNESDWDGVRDSQKADGDEESWNVIVCPACHGNPMLKGNCMMCGNTQRVRIARVK